MLSHLQIRGAREGDLKNISLNIPRNRLVVITGLSGSGKSTLAVDVIYQECQRQYLEAIGYQGIRKPDVDAVRNVSPAIRITQTESNRNPRSTLGTSTDIYTDLRMVYEKLGRRVCPHCGREVGAADCREETEKSGSEFRVFMYCVHCGYRMEKLTRSHFSYNTREGACPEDVLNLPVDEALRLFEDKPKLAQGLQLIQEVGLGYLELGQSLTTLSGSEAQRLKLARELLAGRGKSGLYLMDEPTTGLHPVDVEHFLQLIHRMVDAGSTVIVVEHNEQVIAEADWILEMGPEGGNKGGELVYAGPPARR